MRLTITGTGLIDCEGTIKSLGKEKYQENYKKKSVLAHAKLSLLEDIEEELGIDLVTYFKIKSAKSVYVKELSNDISEMLVRPSKDSIDVCYKGFVNIPECDSCLRLKDYGQTWALTKEELK